MCQGCCHPQLAIGARAPMFKQYRGTALTRQRSTDPEIFTFDYIPNVKPIPTANSRLRSKRRAVKVLYPAQVRKYLPPEKKDWAKRMLLLFLAVLVVQVYTATEVNEESASVVITPVASAGPQANLSGEWASGVSTSSEEAIMPNNGGVPPLPRLPVIGANAISPSVISPSVVDTCYRMSPGSVACRM